MVSAACLAQRGFKVIGVDVDVDKIDTIQRGISPVIEEGIGDLTASVVKSGMLEVTTDSSRGVVDTDVSLICVGTPSSSDGALSTEYLEKVTLDIGRHLAKLDRWHVVIYRSTMLPGTCEGKLLPMLEQASGKKAGVDFGVCVNPEFLREGTSIRDFLDPPKTVVGAQDERSVESAFALYEGLPGLRFHVPIKVAEMVKYIDNSFHAVKVCFANEMGAICASVGVDSHSVIDVFLSDTRLNLGPAYLRPGFAFGGSCLPKDVRAVTHLARERNVNVPLLTNVLPSNESHLSRVFDLVVSSRPQRIGVFGLAFKPGTDDLRESPMVELVDRLLDSGFDVKIYDPKVVIAELIGSNRLFASKRLPEIRGLVTSDLDSVIAHGDVLIVGSPEKEIAQAVERVDESKTIIDLVRLPMAAELRGRPNYKGISW
jgi:GDP-mannose 6-dehydrogenase